MKRILIIISVNLVLSLAVGQQNIQIIVDEIFSLDFTPTIINILEEEVKLEENSGKSISNFKYNFLNYTFLNSSLLSSILNKKIIFVFSSYLFTKTTFSIYKLNCSYMFYH